MATVIAMARPEHGRMWSLPQYRVCLTAHPPSLSQAKSAAVGEEEGHQALSPKTPRTAANQPDLNWTN